MQAEGKARENANVGELAPMFAELKEGSCGWRKRGVEWRSGWRDKCKTISGRA